MKKALSLLLVGAMTLSMAACGAKEPAADNAAEAGNSEASAFKIGSTRPLQVQLLFTATL